MNRRRSRKLQRRHRHLRRAAVTSPARAGLSPSPSPSPNLNLKWSRRNLLHLKQMASLNQRRWKRSRRKKLGVINFFNGKYSIFCFFRLGDVNLWFKPLPSIIACCSYQSGYPSPLFVYILFIHSIISADIWKRSSEPYILYTRASVYKISSLSDGSTLFYTFISSG